MPLRVHGPTESSPGLHLGIAQRLGATSAQTDPLGACLTADVPSTPAGAVLQRCAAAGAVQWWLHTETTNGEPYLLEITFENHWAGMPAPEVVARYAELLAHNTW